MSSRKYVLSFTVIILALSFLSGCGTPRKNYTTLTDGPLSSKLQAEEAELISVSNQLDQYWQEHYYFMNDPEVEGYLRRITSSITDTLDLPESFKIRLHIVRDPTINASAMITGNIYFHAGLLARIQDENELAFVTAHEVSHAYHRDQLYQIESLKRKTVTFKIMDLILAPPAAFVGVSGLTGTMMNLIYSGAVNGYGRQGEAGADDFALQKMMEVGYDPRRASSFFDVLLNEKELYEKGIEIYFLSSHPSNQQRKQAIEQWIAAHKSEIEEKFGEEVSEKISPKEMYRVHLLNAELNLTYGRYYHALDGLELLLERNPENPEVHFYLGEVYMALPEKWHKIEDELSKKRWKEIKKEGEAREAQNEVWYGKAKESYKKALELRPNYAPAIRGLGEYYLKHKEYDDAKAQFNRYLTIDPGARDRRSIERYLKDIERFQTTPEENTL